MNPTKIVVIGAGSASFGLNTLGCLVGSPALPGCELRLVDRNPQTLGIINQLAQRLNRDWDAGMTITTHTSHLEALEGARFVVSAIEVPPRERLWRQDFEIPLKYGVRQPYAENGGPGGFIHAARNVAPVLNIVRAMEQACPDAWFINFTNPMARICDLVHRYSKIKVVGLCHQIYAGYGMVGTVLGRDLGFDIPEGEMSTHADPKYWVKMGQVSRQAAARVDIKAAGLNHFTWMLSLHDKQTGEDLYPLFAERWKNFNPDFEPLTRRVYDAFGIFPIPGDEHLCEYLPWLSDPLTKPWEKYKVELYDWELMETSRSTGHAEIEKLGCGEGPVDQLRGGDSEGAVEVIESIAGAKNHYHLAADLPNEGYITNLPYGAIVETPAIFSGMGARGLAVGALPEGAVELCRREITAAQLSIDAVVQGDRQKALQCLLLSPGITDMDVAKEILDDYLLTYREHLPTFWE